MIDLIPDEDQQALLESVARFLRDEAPVGKPRPQTFWDQMTALGWLGLSRAEDVGGVGLGVVEEVLLLRECGRYLVSPSLMATMLAVRAADVNGQAALAEELANGAQRAALAIERDVDTVYVIDGGQAQVLVAIKDGRVALSRQNADGHVLPSSDDGVELSVSPPGDPLGGVFDGLHAQLLLAAQLTGIAEAVRDLSTEFAKVREQFGQPIGAFQAIKHACADMAIRAEAAIAQTHLAALAFDADPASARAEVAAALRVAEGAAVAGAEATIQLHGAMGFTEECTAHLYLKRAHLLSLCSGRQGWQVEALTVQ